MKLLTIKDNCGFFLNSGGEHVPIDKISKDEILRLVNLVLSEEGTDFDKYDETLIKHQAHQVIYKSVAQKLADLRSRRKEFIDESARLYLEDYEKYRSGVSSPKSA